MCLIWMCSPSGCGLPDVVLLRLVCEPLRPDVVLLRPLCEPAMPVPALRLPVCVLRQPVRDSLHLFAFYGGLLTLFCRLLTQLCCAFAFVGAPVVICICVIAIIGRECVQFGQIVVFYCIVNRFDNIGCQLFGLRNIAVKHLRVEAAAVF